MHGMVGRPMRFDSPYAARHAPTSCTCCPHVALQDAAEAEHSVQLDELRHQNEGLQRQVWASHCGATAAASCACCICGSFCLPLTCQTQPTLCNCRCAPQIEELQRQTDDMQSLLAAAEAQRQRDLSAAAEEQQRLQRQLADAQAAAAASEAAQRQLQQELSAAAEEQQGLREQLAAARAQAAQLEAQLEQASRVCCDSGDALSPSYLAATVACPACQAPPSNAAHPSARCRWRLPIRRLPARQESRLQRRSLICPRPPGCQTWVVAGGE